MAVTTYSPPNNSLMMGTTNEAVNKPATLLLPRLGYPPDRDIKFRFVGADFLHATVTDGFNGGAFAVTEWRR